MDVLDQYDSLRLVMFSGKGGVGKTTLACSFARRWAHLFTHEKVLLLSTDPAHSIGDVLQVDVDCTAVPLVDCPNLQVQALNAKQLLVNFKAKYGHFLEQLVERGSFVEGEDLTLVWDLDWPGLDEIMGLLEIQSLLNQNIADRIVVDMAPSGHTLNLLEIKDFLDIVLNSLELFQEKHRVISQTFQGKYQSDAVDDFLVEMKTDLNQGKRLLQDDAVTTCLVVSIAQPMSLVETQRLIESLTELSIPSGGVFVNQIVTHKDDDLDIYSEQQFLLEQYRQSFRQLPKFIIPRQTLEPLGYELLDALIAQVRPLDTVAQSESPIQIQWPNKVEPGFHDFIEQGRKLLLIGGKGGVGKTTVAAAIGWALADRYSGKSIRLISIDPAHSLGDVFGTKLGHESSQITDNLSGQEIDANLVLEQFRNDYLWELAEMVSGEKGEPGAIKIAYTPEAWRQIVSQALPGIDELLSLMTVIDLLEQEQHDLIILDMAPTGHLLRFLEMPSALSDWLAWIFKLWMKYQNVLGRVEFMGRLRGLRKQVVKAQNKLQDASHTEFIGVIRDQRAIVAEHVRLTASLQEMNIAQHYIVNNCYHQKLQTIPKTWEDKTIISLPVLPRCIEPLDRVKGAANLLL